MFRPEDHKDYKEMNSVTFDSIIKYREVNNVKDLELKIKAASDYAWTVSHYDTLNAMRKKLEEMKKDN